MSRVQELDVDTEIAEIREVPELELLMEFARVMHEWGFRPFLRGEVSFPTLDHARAVLVKSKYNQPG